MYNIMEVLGVSFWVLCAFAAVGIFAAARLAGNYIADFIKLKRNRENLVMRISSLEDKIVGLSAEIRDLLNIIKE